MNILEEGLWVTPREKVHDAVCCQNFPEFRNRRRKYLATKLVVQN